MNLHDKSMEEFLTNILNILKKLDIHPIIYGSFGVANYLGNFKAFEDIDILIDDDLLNERWNEFKEILVSKNLMLLNDKEHEFAWNNMKVGFAARNILIRDGIIHDFSELISYKNTDALTLKPETFLKAYRFSVKDGYRVSTRGKKDKEIIRKLEMYLAT